MKVTTESGFDLSIPRSFGHYIINKNLISGSTCSMALATDTNTNDLVAVKIMSKKDMESRKLIQSIEKEVSVLKGLDSPFIVKVYDSFNIFNDKNE